MPGSHPPLNPQSQGTARLKLATPAFPQALLTPHSSQRTSLLQSLRLLHLLHTRNKNQHRRALWFRHYSQFRREITLFCNEIGISLLVDASGAKVEVIQAVGTLGGKGAVSKKRKRGTDLVAAKGTNVDSKAAAQRLAYWISADFIPKWYTALTTLASTPSFTPLALTLLALFARTLQQTGALSLFTFHALTLRDAVKAEEVAQEEERRMREEEEIVGVLEAFARERETDLERADVGVVVSRDGLRSSTTSIGTKSKPKFVPKQRGSETSGFKSHSRSTTPLSANNEPSLTTARSSPAASSTISVSRTTTSNTKPESIIPTAGEPPRPPPPSQIPPSPLNPRTDITPHHSTARTKQKKKKAKPINVIDALFAGL